ncbi:2-dehydro-3-deoxygalactonokinase [Paeniglutamicibacter antarcticus]|uniref:2-dehydro-3-deoxygalactonokinase n=1 Tax=Paeniglutamicibacter antarcticus TaxID=494023 RepID=A0ABP9TRU4_9MICC
MKQNDAPRLIALDWGTSSCRVYLLGEGGRIIETRSEPWGILQVAERARAHSTSLEAQFEETLNELCGAWMNAYSWLPVVACGMVGSQQGWVQADYRPTPADLAVPTNTLATVALTNGGSIHIIPGVIDDSALPDVMRGEETQILGALELQRGSDNEDVSAGQWMVLPGTHSKWVKVKGSTIQEFSTSMTGETYNLLMQYSILAKLAETPLEASWDAFDRGLATAFSTEGRRGIMATAFSARTLVLTGHLRATEISDYLSGLMIGDEILSVSQSWEGEQPQRITICGNENLSPRYRRGLKRLGIEEIVELRNTAPAGIWKIAESVGLLANKNTTEAEAHLRLSHSSERKVTS